MSMTFNYEEHKQETVIQTSNIGHTVCFTPLYGGLYLIRGVKFDDNFPGQRLHGGSREYIRKIWNERYAYRFDVCPITHCMRRNEVDNSSRM